ncbi:MAG: c-type cytochrome [Fuerstiella sp.]|nr:c-type cytochrome [Fuerstiella sp.]MCP4859313.1 c-type cytochrome [Fuerstiella sp.]
MRLLLASLLFSTSLVLNTTSPAKGDDTPLWKGSSWIWDRAGGAADAQSNDSRYFRRVFELRSQPTAARLHITVDNEYTLFVNGQEVGGNSDWSDVERYDVTKLLVKGTNVVAIDARNAGGVAAAICWMKLSRPDTIIATDDTWRVSLTKTEGWQQPDFDDTSWAKAVVVSPADAAPWNITGQKVVGAGGRPVITAPPGFEVDSIFEVPHDTMGSWSALTIDSQGRLIASDEKDKGIYRITLPADGAPDESLNVEKLPVDVGGAQGLLWAFDSLYIHAEGKGLYRAKDTDGDDNIDTAELLMASAGGGGHGQHAIVLAPGGKSLYVAAGNHTDLPTELTSSRIPGLGNWVEDLLLPRIWDPRGHAAGRLAPGGWIIQVSPDGTQRDVFSVGYRNQYDLAFNADGELITYDADMEWDMGMPWYRPTRVVHATSGSEFGWRGGTGKWPDYYEDSLPASLNIGPGSPTGVLFGQGAKFPAKFQRACFLMDWTYSTIHAVQLTPRGSSYVATKEDFIVGQPMAVTDAVMGKDGAMYFITGGWATQTYLYRVRYVGDESTAPVDLQNTEGVEARGLRRRLEAMHHGEAVDLDLIFAQLGNDDRFIRYAARIALENQPLTSWRDRALTVTSPMATINAMIALARQGDPEDQPSLLASLEELDFAALSEQEQLGVLRAYQLACIRMGEPNDQARSRLIARLDPLFPSTSDAINKELARLLVYLRSPTIVEKALALIEHLGPEQTPDWGELVSRNARYGGTVAKMLQSTPPARAVHLLSVLRNVEQGWTIEQRRKYFALFPELAQHPGGNSYAGFLIQIRDDALKTCSPDELAALGDLASVALTGITFVAAPPQGPTRKWTKPEAMAVLSTPAHKASYEAGRNLYHSQCAKCHRLNGEGGAVGPDLSTAMRKYSIADMLDSVFEPSKVISEQYESHQVITTNGRSLVGRAVKIGKQLYVYSVDSGHRPQIVKQEDVDEMLVSRISQMPLGLIDPLNETELSDLIAYLQAAGNPQHASYQSP